MCKTNGYKVMIHFVNCEIVYEIENVLKSFWFFTDFANILLALKSLDSFFKEFFHR